MIGLILGNIKRSPIAKYSLCLFNPMQLWTTSEKILKIMSLVKGWFGINKSIRQNSKHSWGAENGLLLDGESFLGDVDSITLNKTATNESDHVAGYNKEKLKLFEGCCDQLFLSYEKPNRSYIGKISTAGLKNRSMRSSGTNVIKSNVIRLSTQHSMVPELWCFENFSIHLRYFVIINMQILFFIWLAMPTTA